jgi:hypothetical protein
MEPEINQEYIELGTFPSFETEKLIAELDNHSLRYRLTEDARPELIGMRGSGGSLFNLQIFIHKEDFEAASLITAKILHIQR